LCALVVPTDSTPSQICSNFRMVLKFLCLLASLAVLGRAGQVTVLHHPANVEFAPAAVLRPQTLKDVIAATLGYSIPSSHWNGLRTHGIKFPEAAVLVEVATGGSPLAFDGLAYNLTEGADLSEMFEQLRTQISATAQRPQTFVNEEVLDLVNSDELEQPSGLETQFLREVKGLPVQLSKIAASSAASGEGQDVVLLRLASFGHLVKRYGDASEKVHSAKAQLQSALKDTVAAAVAAYPGGVLVVVAATASSPAPSFTARHLLQAAAAPSTDLNLAPEFSADYPVVFNIVLFLGIALALAVLAVSAAMATMDPGRDSIIYRMTSTRMKKDN